MDSHKNCWQLEFTPNWPISTPSSALFHTNSTSFSDGKYHVLPSGDLHIFRVEENDASVAYACKVRNTLTNSEESSPPSHLAVDSKFSKKLVSRHPPKKRELVYCTCKLLKGFLFSGCPRFFEISFLKRLRFCRSNLFTFQLRNQK